MAATVTSQALIRRRGLGRGPFWITRDSDMDGRLMPFVLLWRVRPEREPCGRGFIWRHGDSGLEGWIESLWPVEAGLMFGATPSDDVQCVRVGR